MLKKIIYLGLSFALLFSGVLRAKPPKVSGNYEAGSRYALPYDEIEYPTWYFEEIEDIDQEPWAYDFKKGYLQLSQVLKKDLRYVVKYNFIYKDFFAAQTNSRNLINYYRTYSWVGLPYNLNVKLEYYLRQQDYSYKPWDNLTHVPNLLLKWKPNTKRGADLSVRFKAQRYEEEAQEWKDKNQVDSYVGYEERITDDLTVNAKYKYTFRHYTDNPEKTNAARKSVSVGFDYQF